MAYVERLYTACLSQAAYYIEADGEAAIIDPQRDPEPYLALLRERGARLSWILETHVHADFVSGPLDLQCATGAAIVFGPGAAPGFAARIGAPGEEFALGSARLRLLPTPGHTPESCCYLLLSASAAPEALFTGDTLFIGDVGRPDLSAPTAQDMRARAADLYRSLHREILPLPDDVMIHPGHGAGSACGKAISAKPCARLGEEREANYALLAADENDFVRAVLRDMPPAPDYFAATARRNRQGARALSRVLSAQLRPLEPDAFSAVAESALVLDTRKTAPFSRAHIAGALNIGLEGAFATWAGAACKDPERPLLLVCEPGSEREAVERLSRIGFDRVLGFLAGGIAAWIRAGMPVAAMRTLEAGDFLAAVSGDPEAMWIDVRTPQEFGAGNLPGACNLPLSDLLRDGEDWAGKLPRHRDLYLSCAGGYRSRLATSWLAAAGFTRLINSAAGHADLAALCVPADASEP